MRILIAGQTYYPGNNGQAIFTIHLAEGMVKAGHEVAVVVPADKFEYKKEKINGVQVYRLHTVPFTWIHPGAFFNPFPGIKLRTILKEFQPDLIHIQDHYFINWDGVRLAREMGIPVIGTNHFLPENLLPYTSWVPLPRETKIKVLWQLMLWTYNLVDMVTTPTETAAQILSRQAINAPVYPVSCGVNTHWFTSQPGFDRAACLKKWGLNPEASVFFYVGRLDREKRIDLLLQGLSRLLAESSHRDGSIPIQLAIAGTGSAVNELRVLAELLGLDRYVRFLGYVPSEDLPDLFRSGDVFCMPSPEELQSIATLEAMASNKPVLAANARALPELVSSGINGMLFEPGSSESVAEKMQWFIENRDRWASMGYASRSRAVAHSLDNTIRRYEELYERLLGRAPRRYRNSRRVKVPVTAK